MRTATTSDAELRFVLCASASADPKKRVYPRIGDDYTRDFVDRLRSHASLEEAQRHAKKVGATGRHCAIVCFRGLRIDSVHAVGS